MNNWKPIEELPLKQTSIMLYVKDGTGFNIYSTAVIREIKSKNIFIIDAGTNVSSFETIKKRFTHFQELTPPQTNQSN